MHKITDIQNCFMHRKGDGENWPDQAPSRQVLCKHTLLTRNSHTVGVGESCHHGTAAALPRRSVMLWQTYSTPKPSSATTGGRCCVKPPRSHQRPGCEQCRWPAWAQADLMPCGWTSWPIAAQTHTNSSLQHGISGSRMPLSVKHSRAQKLSGFLLKTGNYLFKAIIKLQVSANI